MNRTLKYTLTVLTVVLCSISGYSQVNEGGNPLTFENEKINWRFPVIETEAFDLQEMLVEDEINNQYKDNPYRFGKNFVMGKNLNNSGDWHVLPNGDRVWLLGISSPEALSINLSLINLICPKAADSLSTHLITRMFLELIPAPTITTIQDSVPTLFRVIRSL